MLLPEAHATFTFGVAIPYLEGSTLEIGYPQLLKEILLGNCISTLQESVAAAQYKKCCKIVAAKFKIGLPHLATFDLGSFGIRS
jgi:hypothetical protein